MTDKQIIIDGVDVSGCEFYNKDDKTCREVNGKYDTDICDFDPCKNSNCYYKQLKRKEQECDMWKNLTIDNGAVALKYQQQLEAYKMEAEEGKEINAELKAENEELKRLIAKQKNAKIQLSKLKDKQYKEFCDMKQTLTEIKEIAKNGKRFAERYMITGEQKANVLTYANAILQKISGCEGNNDLEN